MAEKILKTRISLKYDSYANWENVWATFVPNKGEVCFFHIPAETDGNHVVAEVVNEPTIMYKVGDGTTTLQSLPWGAAIASDVYEWAKKASLDWADLDETFKAELETFVGDHSVSDVYQLVENGEQSFKLQKKDESAEWEDVSTIDLATAFNKKVDKEISGTNGTAYIFNETDGGGARFVHNDGTESFVGVNDGGENGLMAQIYADKQVDGKWQGAKLDVTNEGMYYTVGNKSFAERAVAANEIATKGDVAKKVDKEIDGTAGKAMIFNEADGGGAKFEYKDGTASYVGVHDKTNGVGAQIYVDDSEKSGEGVIIDVTGKKAYYHKGAWGTATERDVDANEIATIGDITGTVGNFNIIEKSTAAEGYLKSYALVLGTDETGTQKGVDINIPKDFLVKSASIKVVTEKDVPYSGAEIGDKYIDFVINAKDSPTEDEHVYLPVKDLVDVYTAGKNIDVNANNEISLKDNFKAEINTNGDKAIIFNEADGGGAKYENADGSWSYVGVNQGEKGVVIYDVDSNKSGARINTANGKAYYYTGTNKTAAELNNNPGLEIATKGDVNVKLPVYEVTVNGEAGTYTGQANVPVYFDITPATDKVTVNSYSIGLTTDAEQTAEKFTMDVPCATSETAGLMSAADKNALDYVANVQEGDGIDIKTTVDNKPVINVSLNDIAAEGTTPAHYSGLKFTDNKLEVDEDLIWVFDCGSSTELI